MATWLVTGGAGFIGANFVRTVLATAGPRVVVLDRLTYAGHLESLAGLEGSPRFEFLRGDVADRADVEAAYRAARPDAVFHFAAETHVDRSIDGPGEFLRTNVLGTQEMLEGARRRLETLGPAERERFRFVHVSTDEVYGSLGTTGRFTEGTAYAPRSPYAASKAAADHLALAWHATFGVPVIVTNTSNNYGPYQYPEKLIPLLVLSALNGRPLPVYGDGLHVRDWIHVSDHVEGLLAARASGRPGERYNLGAHAERTNLEVVGAVCAALERRRPAAENPALRARGVRSYRDLITHVADRPGHDRRYALDASKARRELGWSARVAFDVALDETVGWYVDHLPWCEAVAPDDAALERRGLVPPPPPVTEPPLRPPTGSAPAGDAASAAATGRRAGR